MIELSGDHARWISEPGPFLDDLDAIDRGGVRPGALAEAVKVFCGLKCEGRNEQLSNFDRIDSRFR